MCRRKFIQMAKQQLYVAFLLILLGCASEGSQFKAAEDADTIPAYQSFLREHPDSQFSEKAKSRIQKKELDSAIAKNDVTVLRAYMDKYPNSHYYFKALADIERLEWEKAKTIGTKAGYLNFVKSFPGSPLLKEARTAIEALTWDVTVKTDSQESYKIFLKQYPNSTFRVKALTRLSSLEQAASKRAVISSIKGLRVKVTNHIQRHGTTVTLTSNLFTGKSGGMKTVQGKKIILHPNETYLIATWRVKPTRDVVVHEDEIYLRTRKGKIFRPRFKSALGGWNEPGRSKYMISHSDNNANVTVLFVLPKHSVSGARLIFHGNKYPVDDYL